MSRAPLAPHPFARLLVVAATLALAGAAIGLVVERSWLGADVSATRARVAADIRGQFAALTTQLHTASGGLTDEASTVVAAASGDLGATLALFDLVNQAHASESDLALSVYGADAAPLAWSGRPTSVPSSRLIGPEALFLGPSPVGLRLVLVEPILDATSRRVGSIVSEVALPLGQSGVGAAADVYELPTSIVPVMLRPRFEGAVAGSSESIVVTVPETDETLAVAEVPDAALHEARARWRRRLLAAEVGGLAVLLFLVTGPLLDWRRRAGDARMDLWLTAAVAVALVLARGVAGVALEWAAGPTAANGQAGGLTVEGTADATALLLTTLTLGGLVALAASTVERWHARAGRAARRAHTAPSEPSVARLVAWHLPAGTIVAAGLAAYQSALHASLPGVGDQVLSFSLHPWDLDRVLFGLSLVILHAAVLGAAVFVLRTAFIACGAPRPTGEQVLVLALWALPAVAGALAVPSAREIVPVGPSLLAMAFVMAAAWKAGVCRLALGHASQAQRLAGFFLALLLPSVVMYPSLADAGDRARRQVIETRFAGDVIDQRADLQLHLAAALDQIDRMSGLDDLVAAASPSPAEPVPTDAAFLVWSQTELALQRLTSSVELYDQSGELVSRFALNLPDTTGGTGIPGATCAWQTFEEVSPFFAEERRLLHAGRRLCNGPGPAEDDGWVEVHVMLDYGNLPFITAQNPYLALLRTGGLDVDEAMGHHDLELAVYGWSRRALYTTGADAWLLTDDVFERIYASRTPFWTTLPRGDSHFHVYLLNDRGAIYALGYPQVSYFGHLIALAELTVLVGAAFLLLLAGGVVYGMVVARTPTSGRALLREIRGSFYRKLYLAFVLAAVVPVLALAVVTRTYIAGLMRTDVEGEATRTAAAASRVVEDLLQAQGELDLPRLGDDLVVWLSRVVAQDVNIYQGPNLLASSERNLFASGLLSTRTPGDVYRAIALEGRPTFVGQESVGLYPYLVAAAPVRIQNRDAILSVPLTLRQREIERQIDELDRRVLLAALAFILVGAAMGYSMTERIADPVGRLMRATKRIAAGDLDARVIATSRDELERLVVAFNGMAAELQRQRAELERTNRLEAWAEMARQVAHDIKNPLTPIQLNAEHLRRVHADRGRPLDPVLDECVTTILTQVRLLRQIAAEFSSFASSPVARPVSASLGDLIAEVTEPYRTGLADRIAIEVRVHEPLPRLWIDRTLVGRALTNVIENALHAMPGRGTLTIDAGPVEARVLPIVVRDTGMGMDEEAVAKIFEPYFSTKATGTGLGLTIARRNIELNGGTIHVASTPGEGATVTIHLPVPESPLGGAPTQDRLAD